MYHIDIMTLFPDVVGDMLCESILGRGQERGWYSPEQAQSDKIQQAYTKYSNQQPTGQQ